MYKQDHDFISVYLRDFITAITSSISVYIYIPAFDLQTLLSTTIEKLIK